MGSTGFLQRGILSLLGTCALALLAPAVQAADKPANPVAEDDQVIAQARAAYYSLKEEGVAEFRCRVVPNFDKMFATLRKTDAADADLRAKIFAKTRFDLVVLLRTGEVTLTHSYDGEVPASQTVNQVYDGMDKVTRAFFSLWRNFMVVSVFPVPFSQGGRPYVLEKVQSQYYLSYADEHSSALLITMDQDMLMSRVKINNRNFREVVSPRFEKAGGKLVLIGFDDIDQATGQDMKVDLHVKIDNQMVDGFQLPRQFGAQGSVNGQAFEMAMTFTDCHVTKGNEPPLAVPAPAAREIMKK